jgi:hypothetical protein
MSGKRNKCAITTDVLTCPQGKGKERVPKRERKKGKLEIAKNKT